MKNPTCCEDGGGHIEWREADSYYGPEKTGWAVIDGMTDYGAAHTYMNIYYCPFCGQRLLKPEKRTVRFA